MAAISLQRAGNVDLAFGLTWHPLQNPEQIDPLFEARQFAAEKNAQHAVIVGANKAGPMVGLWVDEQGRKPARGVLSASALLAGIGDGRRLAVATLPDGNYWLSLSNSNGLLDPDLGDVVGSAKLIGNRLDAAATRISSAGNREFSPTVIGDVQLDSPWVRKSTPTTWATILAAAPASAEARIQPLSRGIPRWLLIAAGLIAIAVGWTVYTRYTADQARQADAAAKQLPDADAQRLRTARITETVTAALSMDTQSPSPSTQARVCALAAEPFGWRYHGWRVAAIVCEPATNTLKVSLNADFTSFDAPLPLTLKRAVDAFGARVEFGPDMQTATIQHMLPAQPLRSPLNRDSLPRFEQHALGIGTAISALRADLDRIGATFGTAIPKPLRFKDPTQRDPTTNADIEVDVPASDSYMTVSVDVTSDHFAKIVGTLAPYETALRLDRVEFTPTPDRSSSRITLTHFLHP